MQDNSNTACPSLSELGSARPQLVSNYLPALPYRWQLFTDAKLSIHNLALLLQTTSVYQVGFFFIKSILTCVTDSPRYQNSCHGVSKLLAGSEKGLTLCTKPSMTGQVPPDVFAPPVRNKVNDIYQILMLNNETIIPQISNTLLQESKLRRKSDHINNSYSTRDN